MTLVLPEPLRSAHAARLAAWRAMDGTRRLWARDASLWTGKDEARWLGWLDVVAAEQQALPGLERLAAELKSEGITHVAVIGMGGSSLCPAVLSWTVGGDDDDPELCVLDSTDPSQIRAFEQQLNLDRTLFVVSSKSGSTLEPGILRDYFLARVRERAGELAGRQFVAITDPGSLLEQQAKRDRFRAILPGVPDIGGRFSALSHFGMAPAVFAGLPVRAMLGFAERMVTACREDDPAWNPGVSLGALLAEGAAQGRDKLTLVGEQPLDFLGVWLEQLVAESTGKNGRAVIPVDRERLGPPERYGTDRLFVRIRVEGFVDPAQDAAIVALVKAGQPVVDIEAKQAFMIGAEFFRWEVATAVCGAIMGLNPFDQPDVEAAKVACRTIMDDVERSGALPAEEPFYREGDLRLFADAANAKAITGAARQRTLAGLLAAHLARLGPGDYLALLAFLDLSDANDDRLQAIRHLVRDRFGVATTVGFGPRYLHSTGQAHKGGPNTGVFVQVTCDEAQDLPVPGRRYSFGTVKAAQARGDYTVLAERGRRALRVHLGPDVAAGLAALEAAVRQGLS